MSETCPRCGKEKVAWCGVPGCKAHVEVYSRPCGYLRPIVTWNDGKQAEFEDRATYTNWGGDTEWYHKYASTYTDKCKHDECKTNNE